MTNQRQILESPEVFEAYARIDLRYYGIQELQKEIEKFFNSRSPIDVLVDDATGHGKHKSMEWCQVGIDLITDQIEDKKFICADYSWDENFLQQLLAFKQKYSVNSDAK